jgi:ankyrin repeat protein
MDVDDLCEACIHGNIDRARGLLVCLSEDDKDIVNDLDDDDTTAMEYAIANGHLHIVRLLYETYGAQIDTGHFLTACQCGRTEVTDYLLARGIRLYDRACVKAACEKGSLDIVRDAFFRFPCLFDDDNGYESLQDDTPLSLACFYDKLDVVAFLVETCKVDIDARGGIALHSACHQKTRRRSGLLAASRCFIRHRDA